MAGMWNTRDPGEVGSQKIFSRAYQLIKAQPASAHQVRHRAAATGNPTDERSQPKTFEFDRENRPLTAGAPKHNSTILVGAQAVKNDACHCLAHRQDLDEANPQAASRSRLRTHAQCVNRPVDDDVFQSLQ
jgi:hypothetical protein